MEEKEQEEKQNYLRQNILDKGYDANEFVSFLISKKGEAASDISNWSMKDLHVVVQEFIITSGAVIVQEIESLGLLKLFFETIVLSGLIR